MIIMLLVLSCRLLSNSFLAPGNISGYVFNYYGLAISGATVGIENGPLTSSGPDGYFFLEGVIEGDQDVGCGKAGYNISWINVQVVSGDTAYQNFTLTQPAMVINPLLIEATINPGEYFTTSLTVLNNGTGPLSWQADISYLSMPSIPCEYSIALYDSWGDGWSGSSIDVLVNDSIVLDNISLSSGAGPAIYYFTVFSGDQITTDFNPGSFITEPYYYIYDGIGSQVWYSPAGSNGPPDIPAGQLTASCAAGEWLTMEMYQGEVTPFGGVDIVKTHLNAAGTNSGDVYEANIVFSSNPNVGSINIPVTMTVLGNEISSPENFTVELLDLITGKVELNWDWNGDDFQFFMIKRDGAIIATTTSQVYTDILIDYGVYCYTVQAVYNEGVSTPAGPLCLEWPNPLLIVDPDDIEGWVWTGFTVDVNTTIANQGEGTLTYSFPEFTAANLLKDPLITKNKPGSPLETRGSDIPKGDESDNGTGYPIVLGAGGPDDFGYTWIDSDESGGPVFQYTDISTTGTPIFGIADDNIVGPFNIGFDFYYYGEIKSQFWVNSNGCIGFNSNEITLGNTTLPTNSSSYTDFIAWMWDDLVFKTGSSQAFYQVFTDRLIIQFKKYERYLQANLPINAEVVLYKNGKVRLIYDNFSTGVTLNSCSVGMQSSSPGIGLQVVYNSAYLHNALSVLSFVPGDFITNVEPASGIVPEGGSEVVTITYDSKDYVPGPITQELLLESNDLDNQEYIIDNTMHVYLPAAFGGVVYDNDNNEPVWGVLVTAGPYHTSTGENGEYNLLVDEGDYDLTFEKLGYISYTVADTSAFKDEITTVNIGLWDMNYAPGMVHAEVMADDSLCEVNWENPCCAPVPGVESPGDRDVMNFEVVRYSRFDPDEPPETGISIELGNTTNSYYNDYEWADLTQGWYAYGVRALYTSGLYSDYTVSNIVGCLMDCQVTFNVTLASGLLAEEAEITLSGLDYPYETYSETTSDSGTAVVEMVWKGHYNITIDKIGYEPYFIENTYINNDKVFNIILIEKKYPPTGLVVDPLSLIATWNEPLITALVEDFEDPVFPPAGWQSLSATAGYGWFRSSNASSISFIIPPWDSYYAVVNNDTAGTINNGCCDYLITPPLDLRESAGYSLTFDSFYNGNFGQLAFVEYSVDEGENWEVLYQLVPDTSWTDLDLDLASFSGMEAPGKIWFAFHAVDNVPWASGWAIDNIRFQVPDPAANYIDFSVFLDDSFIGTTTETSWDFAPLAYGQTYSVSVAARYSSGLSSKDHYTFTSTYLFPAQNLTGNAPDDAAILAWDPPGSVVPYNLLGYNIYRDDVLVVYKLHAGDWVSQDYVEEKLQPGIYSYTVTGVYDLEPYGLPGETGESMKEGPAVLTFDYCNELEFIETWTIGSFGDHSWTSDGPNWTINGLTGNPAPVAEFSRSPEQTDYEIALESYPLCAVGMTEGNILLDFDLALFSVQPTGEEFLQIQVWEWISQEWITVAEFSNINGSFDWTAVSFNIRAIAMNKVFKVRFNAKGANSTDIRGWFVDNVHIYRSCTGPENLAVDPYYYDGIRLTWELPEYGYIEGGDGTRDLTAFNVYRSINGGDYELMTTQFEGLYYIEPDSNLVMGASYCYMVSAVWTSETDRCESAFSNEACVIWTDISGNESNVDERTSLYPNPANNYAVISSPDYFKSIKVYNATGQPVFNEVMETGQYKLNTAAYPVGVYFVIVETSAGMTTRKLTIQR